MSDYRKFGNTAGFELFLLDMTPSNDLTLQNYVVGPLSSAVFEATPYFLSLIIELQFIIFFFKDVDHEVK